jgi:hypothetical protein
MEICFSREYPSPVWKIILQGEIYLDFEGLRADSNMLSQGQGSLHSVMLTLARQVCTSLKMSSIAPSAGIWKMRQRTMVIYTLINPIGALVTYVLRHTFSNWSAL